MRKILMNRHGPAVRLPKEFSVQYPGESIYKEGSDVILGPRSLALVANNISEFGRISDLTLQNWTRT